MLTIQTQLWQDRFLTLLEAVPLEEVTRLQLTVLSSGAGSLSDWARTVDVLKRWEPVLTRLAAEEVCSYGERVISGTQRQLQDIKEAVAQLTVYPGES